MYWDRIETIKSTVDPDRLIVWELGVDGWEPICEKLGGAGARPSVPAPARHERVPDRVRPAAAAGVTARPNPRLEGDR